MVMDFNLSMNHSYPGVTLEQMNSEKIMLFLPVIVIVVTMMVLGITGNSLVCYIYYFRMKKSPSHYFVLFLAVLDLVSCCIGMPSELGDLVQPYTFSVPAVCKILRLVLSFTVISSCIILICVAFDRYYKVCRPLKGFPIRKVKILCIIAMTVGAVLSWPALVVYGVKTVETGYPGLTGTECSTSDDMKGTIFPLLYSGVLILAFLVTFSIFTTLYIRIGVEIHKRKRMNLSDRTSSVTKDMLKVKDSATSTVVSEEESTSALSDDNHSRPKPKRQNSLVQFKDYIVNHFRPHEGVSGDNSNSNGQMNISNISKARKKEMHTLRTTYIFLAVFIAFLISFVPFLIANILKFSKVTFHVFNSDAEEIVYNLCVRSYFISNFINPIIYSLLNQNFKKECRRVLKSCCRGRC